jgi:ferric-dicitrate binding protein FerR (iron transport regulator)
LKRATPQGLSSEEEQKLLEKGLQRFTAHSESRYRTRPAFPKDDKEPVHSTEHRLPVSPTDYPAIGEHEEQTPEKYPTRIFPASRWIAAASILALLTTGALVYLQNKNRNKTEAPVAALTASREVATKYGARTFIVLPDSSKCWLNAGSKVQYANGFAGGKRELTLYGEAFFDVRHDVAHPFIIHAGKLDVKVLGTSLNVKAYPGDSLVETTLIKGKVEIDFAGDPFSKIVLRPSEKVVIHTSPADMAARTGIASHGVPAVTPIPLKFTRQELVPDPKDGTLEETSWVENKLVFRKEAFSRLAMKLERWYDVKIRFEDEKYLKDTFTGAFKDQRIEEVMQALQISSAFHYRISGDSIRIW